MNKAICEYNIQILEGTLNLIDDDLEVISHKLNEIQVKKIAINSIVKCLKTQLVDIVEDKKEVNLSDSSLPNVIRTPLVLEDKE